MCAEPDVIMAGNNIKGVGGRVSKSQGKGRGGVVLEATVHLQ